MIWLLVAHPIYEFRVAQRLMTTQDGPTSVRKTFDNAGNMTAENRGEVISVDQIMRLFELASTADLTFKMASSEQKRELLQFMLSNSSWVDGKLEVEMFEAFDLMLNLAETATQNVHETVENGLVNIKSVDWWR